MKGVEGYHAEWNVSCPGGWEYQRMTQVRGKLCWGRIKKVSGIDLDLDFDHPLLNPVFSFMDTLIRAHETAFPGENPFILLVAEKETLNEVPENINLVEYLNRIDGVRAAMTCPEEIEKKGGRLYYRGRKISCIFLDMNNHALLKIDKKRKIEALLSGIKKGMVMNPRGLEPLGDKGIFEAVTGELQSILSPTTVQHTPWTRLFIPGRSTGPHGEEIKDLVEWVRDHWKNMILKPVFGYSGRGIFVGSHGESRDENIQTALEGEPYIAQSLIPEALWAEEFPWPDLRKNEVVLKQWQTDFRCLINDKGLMGFAARFGGIPTNVGSGGGNQAVAILKTDIPIREAVDRFNHAVLGLGYDRVMEIQEETDRKGLELGHTYLKKPTPTTLRPRIITPEQLDSLKEYSTNLWNDLIKLEKMWMEGRLNHVVRMNEKEAEIARMQPWTGTPALVASDCLFNFGADISDKGGSKHRRG